jgi:hypothetical protein
MNFKTAFIALSVSALAVFGVGCGNDCDDAADRITAKFEECGIDVASGGDAEGGECTEEAGAAAQKAAGCVEAASCEGLKGEDLEAAAAYAECIVAE